MCIYAVPGSAVAFDSHPGSIRRLSVPQRRHEPPPPGPFKEHSWKLILDGSDSVISTSLF